MSQPRRRRLLLGQLVSYGDCLYATAVARQIKHDEPDCHLTWAISASCRSILKGNPHVDAVWEIPAFPMAKVGGAWQRFEKQARRRTCRGDFDEVFFTQVSPGFVERYDGTIRSSILRGYPRPITVPVTPVIRLDAAEVSRVEAFAAQHGLSGFSQVVLFECAPASGQSFVTPEFSVQVARKITAAFPDTCVILSSAAPLATRDAGILDGSSLSFRENAELTKYCSFLIGCSSGISWLATSDWAKPLPMVQLLAGNAVWANSFVQDHERWGLPVEHIIELSDASPQHAADCVATIFRDGFAVARSRFHEAIEQNFRVYELGLRQFLRHGLYARAGLLLKNVLMNRRIPTKEFVRLALVAMKYYPEALVGRLRRKRAASPSG